MIITLFGKLMAVGWLLTVSDYEFNWTDSIKHEGIRFAIQTILRIVVITTILCVIALFFGTNVFFTTQNVY